MQYNRSFDIHEVSGLLVYQQREKINANSGSLQKSLPYRNQGLSGRFTYSYDSRYGRAELRLQRFRALL